MQSYLLQHATGAIPFVNAYFGRGTGAILLDYVSCTGNEQFLANCTNNGVGITSSFCSHYRDSGVHCPGNIYFSEQQYIATCTELFYVMLSPSRV